MYRKRNYYRKNTGTKEGLSGSNTQLEVLLNDSDCKPCTSFATSLTTQREKELTVETVDPKQEVFDSLSEEVMWNVLMNHITRL